MTIWSIYMVRCADNSLYTGITTNVERRFSEHAEGKGAKYLKTRRPFKLVFQRPVGDRSQASKLEYAVKQLPKTKKELIVTGKFDVMGLLSKN
ncbi:MAG: GIY-YIG nuclease family protein [Anaerolineae bacterium]